jgi:6-bladed beta-propeller
MRMTLLSLAIVVWLGVGQSASGQSRPAGPLLVVGSQDGSSGELFSRIRGVAVDRFGRIIVLDAGEHRLVVVKPSGERLQYLGRRGAGPGEYLSPMAIALTDNGRLFVVDPQTSRLTEYSASSADSVRYIKDWLLSVRGYELCTAGERVFVQGDSEQRLIHEVSFSDRATLRSFAELKSYHPLATSPFVRPLLTHGALACSPNGDFVAFAPTQLGEVRVFRSSGQEQLFVRLTPFREIGVIPVERGFRYDYTGPFFQQNVALVVHDDGALVVQIVTLRPRDRQRSFPETFEFRELSPMGTTRNSMSGTGRLAALTPTRVVCTREEPFPLVLVYDRPRTSSSLCP